MTERPLTARQAEILEYLRAEVEGRGMPPTIREIGQEFGIRSTKGVEDHLAAIERKGYIRRERGKSRAIELPSMFSSTASRNQEVFSRKLRSRLAGVSGSKTISPGPERERADRDRARARVLTARRAPAREQNIDTSGKEPGIRLPGAPDRGSSV